MENNMVACEYCGEIVPEDQIVVINGHSYCPDCVAECDDCGEVMPCFMMREVSGGDVVCLNCRDNDYTYCDACEEYVPNSDIAIHSNGRAVCDGCHDNGYRICYECGAVFDSDESGYYDGEDWFCDDCRPDTDDDEYEDDVFMSYMSNPTFRFYGTRNDAEPLYYGVELEVDDGRDAPECAEDIMRDNSEIYCKRDGSLTSDGFEIITHPCTLDYHLNNLDWDSVRQICRSYGFVSDQASSSCGLHIHIGKEGLKKNSDAKLVTLVDQIWDDFAKITRRGSNQWARRPEIDKIDQGDSEDVMIDKAKAAKNGNRYQAVNLETGEHYKKTVEIRAYKGTLNVNTIKACLIFTDCMARYVNSHTIKQCSTATIYDVAAMSDNPILKNYMEHRGLTGSTTAAE